MNLHAVLCRFTALRKPIENLGGQSDSKSQPFDLESDALPLRHSPFGMESDGELGYVAELNIVYQADM